MERFTSAALREVLEKVAPAIAAGGASVISVEAIRDRSSDRWPRKREQVAAFVERAFGRLSQPGDFVVALNDAEFLTVQPSVTRTTALSISANILKETLAFFLGAAARDDLRLFQVTAFTNGELTVQPVDAGLILDGEDAGLVPERAGGEPGAEAAASKAALAPFLDDLAWVGPLKVRLTSPPNIELDLAITPEPTWNVGARVVASYLLRPSMWITEGNQPERETSYGELSPALAAEVGVSGINYAADLIAKDGVQVALHVPLPFNAMTYSTSRYRLLEALRVISPQVRRFLILEVTELTEGLPQGRLTEVVSMLSSYCRAVLARAPSETADVRAWRGCGLSGVTLDCQHLDAADRSAQHRLAVFARRAAETSLACVGYGLPATSLMLAAWASGFTHLGGPALSEEVAAPRAVVRLGPEALFASKKMRDRRQS
jgi:hypothetical protein